MVEFSPATREARVRFPASAFDFFPFYIIFVDVINFESFIPILYYHILRDQVKSLQTELKMASKVGKKKFKNRC